MGYGTRINILFSDIRPLASGFRLELSASEKNEMNQWDPPSEVPNNNKQNTMYAEFRATLSGHGQFSYTLKDDKGKQLLVLTVRIDQDVCFTTSRKAWYDFQVASRDYVLEIGNGTNVDSVFTPGSGALGEPPHWGDGARGHLDFAIKYVGETNFKVTEMCWLVAHNAFTNPDEGWLIYQQNCSIRTQFEQGIRAFMLDTWEKDGEVVLAHGGTDGVYAMQKRGNFQTLDAQLSEFAALLEEHPSETIFLFLETYASSEALFTVFAKFSDYLYGTRTHKSEDRWIWEYPRLLNETMDGLRKKMVVFVDEESMCLPFTNGTCIETVYGDKSLDDELERSMVQRDKSKASDVTAKDYPFLFINNFPDVNWEAVVRDVCLILSHLNPDYGLVALIFDALHDERLESVNEASKLQKKVDWAVQGPHVKLGQYGKAPNFLALDFVMEGTGVYASGYASSLMLKEYIDRQSVIYPADLPLAVFGLGEAVVSAFLTNGEEKIALEVVDGDVRLVPPGEWKDYDVELTASCLKEPLVVATLRAVEVHGTHVWYAKLVRRFVSIASYAHAGYSSLRAYVEGSFNHWLDFETGEARTSGVPVETKCLLRILDGVDAVDVCFVGCGVGQYSVHMVAVYPEGPVDYLCATCMAGLEDFVLVQEVKSAQVSRIPRGFAVREEHPLLEAARKRVRSDAVRVVDTIKVAFPSPRMVLDLTKNPPQPRINALVAKRVARGLCIPLQFNAAYFELERNFEDGDYVIEAKRPDGQTVSIAEIAIENSELAQLRFLVAEI